MTLGNGCAQCGGKMYLHLHVLMVCTPPGFCQILTHCMQPSFVESSRL